MPSWISINFRELAPISNRLSLTSTRLPGKAVRKSIRATAGSGQNAKCPCVHLSIGQSALDVLALHVTHCPVHAAVTLEQIDQGCVGHHCSTFIDVCTLGRKITCRFCDFFRGTPARESHSDSGDTAATHRCRPPVARLPRVRTVSTARRAVRSTILNSTIDAIERRRLPRRSPFFYSARLAGLALTAAAVVALE
jgi:hypothetical protein